MRVLLVSGFIGLMCGCTEYKNEPLEHLDTKSAREVTLTTSIKGDTVYHITQQSIWINGERIAQQTDTLTTRQKVSTWSSEEDKQKLDEIPI